MENKPFPIYQLLDAFEAFSHGEADVKAQHRSLYYFLVGYARKRGNVVRYNMPYETGMHGSHIGSWATYDAALKALAGWGFIEYTPGANRYKVPVIGLTFRNPNDDQLLTYWQSYCISTANPSADLVGTQLVTLKEQLEEEKKRVEELENIRQSNEATIGAANAALLDAEKQIQELVAKNQHATPKSPNASASHIEGRAADVPTPIAKPRAAKKQALTTEQILDSVGQAHPGEEFRNLWLTFLAGSKQKGKQLSAFELMHKKLGKYPEAFAVVMLEKAIQGNWSGVENDGTARAYAEWTQAMAAGPTMVIHRNHHNAGLGSGNGQPSQVAARTQQAVNMMNAYEYDDNGNRLGRRV